MGFNKRYINEEKIRQIVKNEGLEYLINYIKSPDALIIEDDFSGEICDVIRENEAKAFMKLAEMGVYGK